MGIFTVATTWAARSMDSDSVTKPISGMPMLLATAPPLKYAASNPASSTKRAERPSKQPGATSNLSRFRNCLNTCLKVIAYLDFLLSSETVWQDENHPPVILGGRRRI